MSSATRRRSPAPTASAIRWAGTPSSLSASAYGVNALPQTFFLNARHQIVDRIFGAVTLTELHKGIALATARG